MAVIRLERLDDFAYRLDNFGGVQHSGFHRANRKILKTEGELFLYDFRINWVDSGYSAGNLCHYTSDHRLAKYFEVRKCLEICLNTAPANCRIQR